MSATIGYELRPRDPKDFKEMAVYATELTRGWSLKELGYDLTIRDEESEEDDDFYFQGFSVTDKTVTWDDFTGCPKGIPIKEIVGRISRHFPKVEFIYRVFWEGPVAYECIIKNGEETKIEPYGLCLYIENEDDFRRLAGMVQKEELKATYFIEEVLVKEDQCIAILYFESLSQEESGWALNAIMDEITKLLPQSDFYAIFFDNKETYQPILRKAHVMKGKAEWLDAPKIDDRTAAYDDYSDQDDDDYMPFFDGVNVEIFMAIIENRPVPVVEKDAEDIESFPSAESSESDDLPL